MNGWIRQVSPVEDSALLALGDDVVGLRMGMALIQLRCFCSSNKRSGVFASGKDFAGQIERAAGWRGKKGALIKALLNVGALKGDSDTGFRVVNNGVWGDENTQSETEDDGSTSQPSGDSASDDDEARRERERARKAAYRAKIRSSNSVPGETTPCPADERDNTTICPAEKRDNVPPCPAEKRDNVPPCPAEKRDNVPGKKRDCPAENPVQKTAGAHAGETEDKDKRQKTLKTISPPPPSSEKNSENFSEIFSDDSELEKAIVAEIRSARKAEEENRQIFEISVEKNQEKICGEDAASPPSPSRKAQGAPGEADLSAAFGQFWDAWPKKVAKAEAEKAFRQLFSARTHPSIEELRRAIERQTSDLQWDREGYRFCPNPATWLRGRRWLDQTTPAPDPARAAGDFRRVQPPSVSQIQAQARSRAAPAPQEQTQEHKALLERGRLIERVQKAIIDGAPVSRSEFKTLTASAIAFACRKAGITPDEINLTD